MLVRSTMINYETKVNRECDKLDSQLILFLGNILLVLPVSKNKQELIIINN